MKKKMATAVKIWLGFSSVLLTVFLGATIALENIPFLYNTVNAVLGRERYVVLKGNPKDYMYYTADYQTKAEALDAANRLNEEICEEGFVLLKNEQNILPLQGKKITVFGNNSVNLVFGGSGSNSNTAKEGEGLITLYDSLTNAGFEYNPVMKSFYESESTRRPTVPPGMGSILTGYPIAETPIGQYTSALRNSYQKYADAALVVISRIGGEGFDIPRTMFWDGNGYENWSGDQTIPGARSKDDHYLQLDNNETDMLREACTHFENVVLIINSASTLELGFLDDPTHYAYQENLKAALWIGAPGNTGVNALGKILKGEVNPSGRTVDTYARDFKKDPTWNNFGNNLKKDGNRYVLNGKARNAYFVDYEEGIYTGYRYYETRGYEESAAGNADWYAQNVVYPFGYGLSYTNFEWEVLPALSEGTVLAENSEISISVKVTNTGMVAGKDVVQLYYTPPYTPGGIEKSQVTLADFAKTKLLKPNESQTLTLRLTLRDMASYDYSDANKNGFKGYEAEAGKYEVLLMQNAHDRVAGFSYTLASDVRYETDERTGSPIENRFDDVSGHIGQYLSRRDFEGTFPQPLRKEEYAVTQEFISSLTYQLKDDKADPWYSDTMPEQKMVELSYDEAKVKLYQLKGKSYDDPLWEELLNQLTISQMKDLCSKGNYRTVGLINVGKPFTTDADGPMGFSVFMGDSTVYDTCFYACECVLAATFNVDLAKDMGVMVGNEGVLGNMQGDGRPYSGWYAPAVNLHRSQFGGRNFEYYSEDGILSGKMAEQVVIGANSKGVYTYCKHFALNEQETNRDTTGLITWANEQAMRELYFKPFEMVVKNGGSTAMMSSFNRLGATWAGGSYPLLTQVLREEWGFEGMVITDYNLKPYMNLDQMIRAGGDLNLSPGKPFSADVSTTTVTSIRRATKNIMYTVVNSNAMNGIGAGVQFDYLKPQWEMLLIGADVLIAAICCIWGIAVLNTVKKRKLIEDKAKTQESDNQQ